MSNGNLVGLIICLGVAATLCIGIFVLHEPAPPTPDPTCIPMYQGDLICVKYVPETDCMCHAYSLGGLSCTPCKDLSPGVCP